MYALDNHSGVSVMPTLKSKVFNHNEPRWFTEGGNGVAPSYPGADWFNIVQAELLNVLRDGGIQPDKTQLNQITTAIRRIVANAVSDGLSGKANASHTHTMANITDFELKQLSTEDLDTIKKAGMYGQGASANATTARHYPETQAGALLVMPSAYGWMQIYIAHSTYRIYIRNTNNSGGWLSWFRMDGRDKANVSSPTFTGIPRTPTPTSNASEEQIANVGFVKSAIAALVGSAPEALDTLAEIAAALANDGNLKQTLLTEIGKKLNIEDPILKTTKHYDDLNNIPNGTLFFGIRETTNNQPYYNKKSSSFDAQVWQFDTGHQKMQMAFFTENDIQLRINDDGVTWSDWCSFLTGASSNEFTLLKNVMIGVPFPYPLAAVPSGCLAFNGQTFNKTTYPILAQKYPSGVLPDLRGEFIRGWDNGRGVDSGRGLLSAQGDAIRNITGSIQVYYNDIQGGNTATGAFYNSGRTRSGVGNGVSNNGQLNLDVSRVVPTASENRPRSIAFQYICLAA